MIDENSPTFLAARAEWRESLPSIIAGTDPHERELDGIDRYLDLLQARYRDKSRAATKQTPSLAAIVAAVAHEANLPPDILRAESRSVYHVNARHIACYIAKEMYGYSSGVIGRYTNRDHSTVLHGVERAAALIKTDDAIADLFGAAVSRLVGTEA